MRRPLVLVLACLLIAGCTDAPPAPLAAPGTSILVADPSRGLVAVTSPGARNVRVLFVSGPTIVRLREVFVPEGETVSAVHWQPAEGRLIIETDAMRFALDPSTGRMARLAQDPAGLARRTATAARG
jgi:hypothetical protein